jgi:hypothetical protein
MAGCPQPQLDHPPQRQVGTYDARPRPLHPARRLEIAVARGLENEGELESWEVCTPERLVVPSGASLGQENMQQRDCAAVAPVPTVRAADGRQLVVAQ